MLLFMLCTILHFDLNQTIIVADQAGGKSPENVIAHNLSKEVIDVWDDKEMSYFDHIYHHKFKGLQSDKALKKEKLRLLSAFPDFLEEISHPKAEEVREKYNHYCEKAAKIDGLIIPSFYRAVKNLRPHDTIVLRTFGGDLQAAIDEIEAKTPIRFSYRGEFHGHTLHLDDGRVISDPKELATLFRSGHGAVQDNYHYWNSNNERGTYGKLFPYDGDSLFFDDHVNVKEGQINVVAPVCTESGKPLETKELVRQGKIVKAMILDALIDDAYYERWHQRHRGLRAIQSAPDLLSQFRHHTPQKS